MSHKRRQAVVTSTALDPLFDDSDERLDQEYYEQYNCSQYSLGIMPSPLSSPPSSPDSLLEYEAFASSAVTPPMPISSSRSRTSASSRHSSSSSSSSSSSCSSSGSDDTLEQGRRAVRQMMETHALASTARRKLVAEAARSEHKLRYLVGHANFLDACMYGIQSFDAEAIVDDDDENESSSLSDSRARAREEDDRGRTQHRRNRRSRHRQARAP